MMFQHYKPHARRQRQPLLDEMDIQTSVLVAMNVLALLLLAWAGSFS